MKTLTICVILYLFIYNPGIQGMPVSFTKSILPIAIIYLLFTNSLGYLKKFKVEILLFLLLIIYTLLRDLASGEMVLTGTNIFFFLDNMFSVPFLLILSHRHFKIKNSDSFFDVVIKVGFLASVITIILLIFPDLSDFVRYRLLIQTDYTEATSERTFGFAEGLTFAYGIVQGLILSVLIFRIKYHKYYIFLIPFFLISIMFNARIGFVPVICSLVYLLFLEMKLSTILYLSLGGGLLYYIIFQTDLFTSYSETIKWGTDFFIQIGDFILGTSNAQFNTFEVLEEMIVLPTNTNEWLFGTGQIIFENVYRTSDIGYVLQLMYGGIFYLAILLCIVFFICWRINIKTSKAFRWLAFVIFATIIITNVKGNFLTTTPAVRLIFLIYIYIINFNFFSNEHKVYNRINS